MMVEMTINQHKEIIKDLTYIKNNLLVGQNTPHIDLNIECHKYNIHYKHKWFDRCEKCQETKQKQR